MNAAVESRYVSTLPQDPADRNHITRFDVVFKTDPFSETSSQTLEEVHDVVKAAAAPKRHAGRDGVDRHRGLDLDASTT